ncbi:hypothetical protein MRX96_040392 [Rhipicephalus microplus]
MRSASGTGGSSNASAGLVTRDYDVWFDAESATISATAAAVVEGPTPVHLLCTSLAATVGLVLNAYILVVLFWQRQFRTANSLPPSAPRLRRQRVLLARACLERRVRWTIGICRAATGTLPSPVPLHYSRLVNTRRTCAFLGVSWIVAAGAAVPPARRSVSVLLRSVAMCVRRRVRRQRCGLASPSVIARGTGIRAKLRVAVPRLSGVTDRCKQSAGAPHRTHAQASHRGCHLRGQWCPGTCCFSGCANFTAVESSVCLPAAKSYALSKPDVQNKCLIMADRDLSS